MSEQRHRGLATDKQKYLLRALGVRPNRRMTISQADRAIRGAVDHGRVPDYEQAKRRWAARGDRKRKAMDAKRSKTMFPTGASPEERARRRASAHAGSDPRAPTA